MLIRHQEEPLEFEDDLDFASRELYELPSDDEINDNIRYQDFFSNPKKKLKTHEKDQDPLDNSDNEIYSNDEEVEEEIGQDNEDESDEDGTETQKANTPETTHSRQKKKIQDRITEMEQQLIEPKSWDLKGEVASKERPENSLLGLAVSIER
jgi:U3 small nucleolar RNA-associated protein MPP10